MAAKNRAEQRRQRTKKKADAKQKQDRLSSLPDDILIGIIAYLPLPQAIATESLSRRWLGLWTNRTTIQLSNRNYDCLLEFFIAFDDIMTYFTSPVLRSFSFELVGVNNHSLYLPSIDSKLKQICELNVRELKVPIILREANIELTGVEPPAKVDYELMAEFYKVMSNARVLSLHVFALDNFPTTLLRKATSLTLDTKLCNDVDTKIALSSFQELCPKLDALTLKFSDFGKNNAKWILPKPSNLIRYLLSEATYLEHFKFDARGSEELEDFESSLMFK
ncbi:putative F-box/LRR-repeat protein At5g02700 [Silene latifolia]|uniref:putative F-box/LRR-repeat protein At5g02700 n=1 Tax=Silene latifolia TaxID=37657 RepID=UPI003D76F122